MLLVTFVGVAAYPGLAESMLYYWRSQVKSRGTPLEQQKLQQAQFTRIQRENHRLKQENEFLKKAAAYFAGESKRGTERLNQMVMTTQSA